MTLNRTPLITKLPIMIIHALRPPSGGTIAFGSSTSFLKVAIDTWLSSSLSVFFDFAVDMSIFTDEFFRSVTKSGLSSVLEFEVSSGPRCGSSLRGCRSRTPSFALGTTIEFLFDSAAFSAIVIVC